MIVSEIAKNVINQKIKALENLSENLPKDFTLIVEAILNSKGRVIVSGIGKSGIIARKIAASLASTGTKSFFIHASEASHGDLGMIDKDDILLILSNSGNTHELNDIIRFANLHNIPIIGMTKNLDSVLAKNSKYILKLPDVEEANQINAPTTSTTLMIVLGDALVVSLIEKRNFTKDDFKINHPGGTLGKIL